MTRVLLVRPEAEEEYLDPGDASRQDDIEAAEAETEAALQEVTE